MARCSDFNSTSDVGFLNNPFDWAIGAEELQYYRGSVVTVLVAVGALLLAGSCVVAGLIVVKSLPTQEALITLRLPSSVLPIVLLLSEVGTSSATSLLLSGEHSAGDVVMALMLLIPMFAFSGVYAYQVFRGPYTFVSVAHDRDVHHAHESLPKRLVKYLLNPTHEVTLVTTTKTHKVEDDGGLWMRRYFYFVDERRWAPFGPIEVAVGTLSNILEGIPMSDANKPFCVARPLCVLILLLGLMALLLWRPPNAVPLAQFTAIAMTGTMIVSCLVVVTNVIWSTDEIELTAVFVGGFASAATGVLGLVDVVGLLLSSLSPHMRGVLGLRSRSFAAAVLRKPQSGDDLDASLVAISASSPQPPLPLHALTSFSSSSSSPQNLQTSQHMVDSSMLTPLQTPRNVSNRRERYDDEDDEMACRRGLPPRESEETNKRRQKEEEGIDDEEDRIVAEIIHKLDKFEQTREAGKMSDDNGEVSLL